jgi:hypothetical protein
MTLLADTLPDGAGTLRAMLMAERARAERLEQIIKEPLRRRFGRRAETLPEDQPLLGRLQRRRQEPAQSWRPLAAFQRRMKARLRLLLALDGLPQPVSRPPIAECREHCPEVCFDHVGARRVAAWRRVSWGQIGAAGYVRLHLC